MITEVVGRSFTGGYLIVGHLYRRGRGRGRERVGEEEGGRGRGRERVGEEGITLVQRL